HAGNLCCRVIHDGRCRAISADKGEILYEVQTNRTGMAPPITYEVDGKQYVAFGGGVGPPNNVLGPTNASVDNAPMMFVSTLGGKAELPAPPPAPDPATPTGAAVEPRK